MLCDGSGWKYIWSKIWRLFFRINVGKNFKYKWNWISSIQVEQWIIKMNNKIVSLFRKFVFWKKFFDCICMFIFIILLFSHVESFVSNALAFDLFENEASNKQILFYFFFIYRKIKILKIHILIKWIRNSGKLSLKIQIYRLKVFGKNRNWTCTIKESGRWIFKFKN